LVNDETSDAPEPTGDEERRTEEDENGRSRARFSRKIGEGIISGLLEGGAAIRRGQDKVTDVAQGTKEEVLRIVGSEVRGFLDKMDIVDMMQQVVSGLVIDVNAQIRIRRDDEGKIATEVTKQDIALTNDGDGDDDGNGDGNDRAQD
jgi:hypothetical protein